MNNKRRRKVTTIETHEVWIFREPATATNVFCSACPDNTGMLTLQQAADQAGVSQRTVYRWIDEGRIHFVETPRGGLYVCLAPLF